MDQLQEYLSYTHRQHRRFIDVMHQHFGVLERDYVENIQFRPLLTSGGYGIDPWSKPMIFLNDTYLEDFHADPRSSFGRLNLDTTIFHEAGHHLHYKYHGGKFYDVFTLELIIDSAMVYYLKNNRMEDHIENLSGDELVALELYHQLKGGKEFKQLLIVPEKEALDICISSLGIGHSYLKEREEYLKELEEE